MTTISTRRIKDSFLFRWNSTELKHIFSNENVRNSELVFAGVLLQAVGPAIIGGIPSDYDMAPLPPPKGQASGNGHANTAFGGDASTIGTTDSHPNIVETPIPEASDLNGKTKDYIEKTGIYRALVDFFGGATKVNGAGNGATKLNDATKDDTPMRFTDFVDSLLDSAAYELELAEREYPKGDENQGFRDYFAPVEPTQIACSMQFCRSILANAFLGNIVKDPVRDRKEHVGGLNFYSMFSGTRGEMGMHKVKCLIQYLITTERERHTSKRKVIFQKLFMSDREFQQVLFDHEHDHEQYKHHHEQYKEQSPQQSPQAQQHDESMFHDNKPPIILHDSKMENPYEDAFVNFANANYGYGMFVVSCTQEEILQMCCPEMNVGMLMYGKMDDNTVILVHNCRRYSEYTGYLTSFQYVGRCEGLGGGIEGPGGGIDESFNDQTLVTLDAVFSGQYHDRNNLRDTKKAYMAWKGVRDWFNGPREGRRDLSGTKSGIYPEGIIDGKTSNSPNPQFDSNSPNPQFDSNIPSEMASPIRISTGRWGCGAFGGQVLHKYMQQLVAVQLANNDGVQNDGVQNNGVQTVYRTATPARKLQLSFSSFGDQQTLKALEQVQKSLFDTKNTKNTKSLERSTLRPDVLYEEVVLGGDRDKWRRENVGGLVARIERLMGNQEDSIGGNGWCSYRKRVTPAEMV